MTTSADRDSAAGVYLWRSSLSGSSSTPPVVYLPGLGPNSLGKTHRQRLLQRLEVLGLTPGSQVWQFAHQAALSPGVTIEHLAQERAKAIRAHFEQPVDVIGVSTGGSIALQLALNSPELVNRLVIVSAAARMRPEGQRAQRDVARSIRVGDRRRAAGIMLGATTRQTGRARLLRATGYLLGPLAVGRDGEDLAVMIDAEDGFDVRDDLARISSPTLLIGGGHDGYYSPAMLAETAAGLPNAVHVQLPHRGHLSVAMNRTVRGVIHRYLQVASDPPATRAGQ